MKKRHLCIALLTIILAGCTSAPEQPGADAVLPPCGMLPNCVNSDSGTGGSAIAPLQATTEQWQALKAMAGRSRATGQLQSKQPILYRLSSKPR